MPRCAAADRRRAALRLSAKWILDVGEMRNCSSSRSRRSASSRVRERPERVDDEGGHSLADDALAHGGEAPRRPRPCSPRADRDLDRLAAELARSPPSPPAGPRSATVSPARVWPPTPQHRAPPTPAARDRSASGSAGALAEQVPRAPGRRRSRLTAKSPRSASGQYAPAMRARSSSGTVASAPSSMGERERSMIAATGRPRANA